MRSSVIHEDVPYYHDRTLKTASLYDVQDVRQEGRTPIYVMSISAANQGSDFDFIPTRDGAARDMAGAIRELHQCEPNQVMLFQQRSDGNFDRVQFKYMGRDGASAADEERQAADPTFKPGPARDEPNEWSEYHREVYTRADVERRIGGTLHAPAEPYRAKERTVEDDAPGASMPEGFRPPPETTPAAAAGPAPAAAAAAAGAGSTKINTQEQESSAVGAAAAAAGPADARPKQQMEQQEQQHRQKKSHSPSF